MGARSQTLRLEVSDSAARLDNPEEATEVAGHKVAAVLAATVCSRDAERLQYECQYLQAA